MLQPSRYLAELSAYGLIVVSCSDRDQCISCVLVLSPYPSHDSGGILTDQQHILYLPSSFPAIVLIDAYGIDPQETIFILVESECGQGLEEIFRDWHR
jgi:hypothetical protein